MMSNKVMIFSAPSGSGKSTIVNHILSLHPEMEFSVSATSRAPRGEEQNGKEYYFYSADEFRRMISEDKFVEYQEVYPGSFYGTLKSEVQRIWDKGHVIIFDVDVKGGVNLKKYFKGKAMSVFIKAPSIEELRRRLIARNTDTPEAIEKRIAKAAEELTYDRKFDYILINDDLQTAFSEAEKLVDDFMTK
jgi:guanylate kinase